MEVSLTPKNGNPNGDDFRSDLVSKLKMAFTNETWGDVLKACLRFFFDVDGRLTIISNVSALRRWEPSVRSTDGGNN